MFKLNRESLDWSLKHIEKFGDTDIFPVPFEFEAIRFKWDDIAQDLSSRNLHNWHIRPHRRSLTPKHQFGFRVATQLDPLDCIIFNALVYEMGNDIESCRIPVEESVVFSNRFRPTDDGSFFDSNINWKAFQDRCKKLSDSGENYKFVVVADIADFYPRIYLHPLENALKSCSKKISHSNKIKYMLSKWNCGVSYGIPVGPSGTRLLAELAINDIDKLLISQGVIHCRFVDDFRMFSVSEKQAYENLALLANALFENHGLTLQQHKTKILPIDKFMEMYLKTEDAKELDSLSDKFFDILDSIGIDTYEAIEYDDLEFEVQQEIDNLNLLDILREQISLDEIDSKLVSFVLRRLGQLNNTDALEIIFEGNNIDKLYTSFKSIFQYIYDLSGIDEKMKERYGNKLLDLMETSIFGHLEYHRAWLLGLFASDFGWSTKRKFVDLYGRFFDQFSRREIILALGKSNADYWFKSQKRNVSQLSAWEKRAFLAAASCLPGDEASHWYLSIRESLDPLELWVIDWAKKHF
jgi:hypothetical protein